MASQVIAVETLKSIVGRFPNCMYSFAYGSAVFAQQNQRTGKMVDLIFVVDNPKEWHYQNIQYHPTHYSFLKYLTTSQIVKIQENWGAGIYYNTLVTINDQLLKYGVISTNTAIDDLKTWRHIYFAGRLHKPVLELIPPANSIIEKSITENRISALKTALLLLPQKTTKFDLYHTITKISYTGDSRMTFGEHPDKARNIAAANMKGFDEIYLPLMLNLKPAIHSGPSIDTIIQDDSYDCRLKHLLSLPHCLQRRICLKSGRKPALHDVEDVLVEACARPNLNDVIHLALSDIVWRSSLKQTLQGIITAGPIKATYYAFEKVKKKFDGVSIANIHLRSSIITTDKLTVIGKKIRDSIESTYLKFLKLLSSLRFKNLKPKEQTQTKLFTRRNLRNQAKSQGENKLATSEEDEVDKTLNDVDLPFGKINEKSIETQTTVKKGFITFTIPQEGNEGDFLKPKGPHNFPPVIVHELKEPIKPNTFQANTSSNEILAKIDEDETKDEKTENKIQALGKPKVKKDGEHKNYSFTKKLK